MINYIIKTLQREDYVFIERLGAFRMQLKHAEIDKDTIHPPHYEIVFSQKDSEENNFALANQISRDKQCLFTQANEEITRWVDELLAALQNNKSVTYEDFGTFMLDKKGNISFESAVIPQLNLQFEGLEPIDLKHFEVAAVVEPEPVPVAEPEPEPVVEPDPEPVVEPEPELVVASEPEPVVDLEPEPVVEPEPVPVAELEPEPVVEPEPVPVAEPEPEPVVELVGEHDDIPEDDDEEKDKDDYDDDEEEDGKDDDEEEEEDEDDEDDEDDDDDGAKKKHHWAWLWILLLLIAVLAVLGFVFKDKLLDYYHQWQEKKHPVEQVDEPADESTESATLEETAEPVDEYAEPEPEPEPEVFTPTVVKQSADGQYDYIRFEQGHYYAIAGSFPNESDVIRHIRQKKLDQYSPKILIQDGVKNLRVCIGVFESEEEAESFAKGINSTYWVLK